MPVRSARLLLFSTETPFGGAGGSVAVAVGVGVAVASGVPCAVGDSAEANTTRITKNIRAKGVVGVDLNNLIVAFSFALGGDPVLSRSETEEKAPRTGFLALPRIQIFINQAFSIKTV